MTHMTQSNTDRNTKKDSSVRGRSWAFTLNNPTSDDIKSITEAKDYKYLFQVETGTQKTEHLQGFIKFENARTFLSVKKLFPKAHLELVKNIAAIKNYCQKAETRTGKIYCNNPNWIKPENLETTKLKRQETMQTAMENIRELPEAKQAILDWIENDTDDYKIYEYEEEDGKKYDEMVFDMIKWGLITIKD